MSMSKEDLIRIIKDTAVIFGITLVAGLGLGFVYELTKEPIATQEAQAQADACNEVFKELNEAGELVSVETLTFNPIEVDEAISTQLKNDLQNSYIHFYTFPQDSNEPNGQQIIYSSTEQNPQLSNAEKYSYKFSKNANLILTEPKDKINLSIKCMKYPCSYELKVKFEKDYANLNLDESNNYSNSYSYFIPGNTLEKLSTMKFKIQSSLNKKYTKGKQLLTISVTNPSDKDAIVLKDSNKNELKENSYITPMGKIFYVLGEDISKDSSNSFYYLEIESMEYQFVSISIKTSVEYDKKIESELIPNESPKYTFVNNTNNFLVEEECFTINEKYVNDNIKGENNDLLYASIQFFSLPIKEIVSNSKSYNSSNSSVYFILEKENNKYPQFCLKLNDN